jgi:hypothetical protein
MSKRKKRPAGNPWTAARARVWYQDGWWHYTVTNWWGRVVAHDMAGGAQGRTTIFTSAAKCVAAVRLLDGKGQGKHFKDVHVQYLRGASTGSASRDTWPGKYQRYRPLRRQSWRFSAGTTYVAG